MTTIPISEARRRWSEVATEALRSPVLLTRHGRPWVLVLPVSAHLLALLGQLPTVRHRDAGRGLCCVAAAVQAGAVLVLAPRCLGLVVLMPAGAEKVSQN